MNDKKNLAIYITIAVIVLVTIIAGSAIFLIGKSDDEAVGQSELPTDIAGKQGVVDVPVGIEKESILRSIDSGLNFETYFRINTEEELGDVDVLGISFYPEVKDKIIVSTYDDGLFLNENKRNQWQPIIFPPQKIYSFILDKKDPDNRAFASGVVSENGRVFRTEDKGETWRIVYAEPGTKTYVSALTQDPVNNDIILAGTSGGTLVRSIDGGDTWKNIGQKISSSVEQFTHDSTKTSFVYLLMRGGKVFHSYDAGITWLNWEEEKAEEIKSLNERANKLSRSGDKTGSQYLKDQIKAIQERNKTEKIPSGIINIVADPNRTGVLYASLSKGLYRSTDYGKYWKPINIIESAEKFPILSVAINPSNSDEISFVSGSSFYRSVNYGSTWAVTPLDKNRNISFVTYDPFDSATIYLGLSGEK
jgi:photosystem II stability/assembly factor-like uncharacterized protein